MGLIGLFNGSFSTFKPVQIFYEIWNIRNNLDSKEHVWWALCLDFGSRIISSYRTFWFPNASVYCCVNKKIGASTINVPSVPIVKIKPNEGCVLVWLNLDDDVCHVVDFYDTSQCFYKTKTSNGLCWCW